MTIPPFPDERVGLCARCRHSRTVPSRTTLFWLCELSKVDPRFDKYPRLPVLACAGFQGRENEEAPPSAE